MAKTQFPWDLLTKKTPKLPNIIFKILTTKHKNVRGKVDYLNNKKHKNILNEKLQFKSQWESTFYLKLWESGAIVAGLEVAPWYSNLRNMFSKKY